MCDMLGFDPLYVANEGKLVLVVAKEDAASVLKAMQSHPLGVDSRIIGRVGQEHPGQVTLKTLIGGRRIIDMLVGDMLPRIC